jgi:hypothetical protein
MNADEMTFEEIIETLEELLTDYYFDEEIEEDEVKELDFNDD